MVNSRHFNVVVPIKLKNVAGKLLDKVFFLLSSKRSCILDSYSDVNFKGWQLLPRKLKQCVLPIILTDLKENLKHKPSVRISTVHIQPKLLTLQIEWMTYYCFRKWFILLLIQNMFAIITGKADETETKQFQY